jgi:hypothetical protein
LQECWHIIRLVGSVGLVGATGFVGSVGLVGGIGFVGATGAVGSVGAVGLVGWRILSRTIFEVFSEDEYKGQVHGKDADQEWGTFKYK